MKKVCKLLIFTLLPLAAVAQYEAILNDPDIIWAAEIDLTFRLHPPQENDSVPPNDIIFWKNYNPKSTAFFADGELLIEKMLDAARSGDWEMWHLSDTVYRIPPTDLFDMETTTLIYDCETLEQSVKTIKMSSLSNEDFDGVRVRQLLFFNEKSGEFGLHTFAIAPVRRLDKLWNLAPFARTKESFLFEAVPFWLKMPPFSKKKNRRQPSVNDSEILWAAQLKTLATSPDIEKLRTLKDFKPPVMQRLLDRFASDPKYATTDGIGSPQPFSERKNLMIAQRDTVVTFDPETYEEKWTIATRQIDAGQISRLRLVQNWYWDERQQRLVVRLDRFAPLLRREKFLEQFSFDLPLFYKN